MSELPPGTTIDHHSHWSTIQGINEARTYAKEFFDLIRTRGLSHPRFHKYIHMTRKGHKVEDIQKIMEKDHQSGEVDIAKHDIQDFVNLHKTVDADKCDAFDLRWGINKLYFLRLHVGVMTEDDAKTLMRALDMDGDGKMSEVRSKMVFQV
jgi:hypothetical protein